MLADPAAKQVLKVHVLVAFNMALRVFIIYVFMRSNTE